MKSTDKTEALVLENAAPASAAAPTSPALNPISILEAAVRGGVTAENVSVVKELVAMCREQRAEDSKAAFAKAFYNLKKSMPEIYADKEAKDRSGNTTFRYCSEEELSRMLNPRLIANGFTDLFGQEQTEGRVIVKYTLIHEAGHSETREFSVRAGAPNAMKDAAMCDTGAATTAWRHLVMKLYGLKSRISDNQDAKLEGERITPDKVQYIAELLKETNSDEARFFAFAGVKTLQEITEGIYPLLVRSLTSKRRA